MGDFDLAHLLQAIHCHQFQDVCARSGEIRTVEVAGRDPVLAEKVHRNWHGRHPLPHREGGRISEERGRTALPRARARC